MTATGLSATPQEYRERLEDQSDQQIDAWAAELMRDISIRLGVREVLHGLAAPWAPTTPASSASTRLAAGRSRLSARPTSGEMMVPAISLYYFVCGARSQMPDARDRLINYLVDQLPRDRLHLAARRGAVWRAPGDAHARRFCDSSIPSRRCSTPCSCSALPLWPAARSRSRPSSRWRCSASSSASARSTTSSTSSSTPRASRSSRSPPGAFRAERRGSLPSSAGAGGLLLAVLVAPAGSLAIARWPPSMLGAGLALRRQAEADRVRMGLFLRSHFRCCPYSPGTARRHCSRRDGRC